MMHVSKQAGQIRIVDQPGPERILAGLFWLVGVPILLLPWLTSDPITPLQGFLSVGAGLIAIATGVYIVRRSPRSTVEIDTVRREIRIGRRSLLGGAATLTLPFGEVAGVEVEQGSDIDSDPCWRLRLTTRDGRNVPLSLMYRHDRKHQDEIAAQVRSALT
jgi:hypothetical protein